MKQRGVVAALSCAYGVSMLAYRPTVMQTMPTMVAALGLSREDGGRLLSLGATVYMFCKPAAQVLSDKVEARAMLVLSMVASGLVFLCIGLASTIGQISLCFALVHVTQALHSPAMLAVLGRQFAPAQRGMPLSIISSSANAVNAVIPLLVTATLRATGGSWRAVFLSQGGCCAAVGLLLAPVILRFRVVPAQPASSAAAAANSAAAAAAAAVSPQQERTAEKPPLPLLPPAAPEVTLREIAKRPAIWLLGLSSTALYVVRFGVEGWLASFFAEGATKQAGAEAAAVFLFWWQAGGFLGSLVAGPLSDTLLGGARTLALVACSAALVAGLAALPRLGGAAASAWALAAVGALCGACVFAQRTLVTLCTREQVPPSSGGRADAIVNLLAELGGVLAGLPLIRLVGAFGWGAYVPALNCAALAMLAIGLVLHAKLRRARKRKTSFDEVELLQTRLEDDASERR